MPRSGSLAEPVESPLRLSVSLATASMVLAIVTCSVFANASVWAGEPAGGRQCGTVLEPNAGTSECVAALRERSWTAAVLLGVALFGAVGAVVLVGSSPPRRRRLLAATAVASLAAVVVSAVLWGGVIDRTFGS